MRVPTYSIDSGSSFYNHVYEHLNSAKMVTIHDVRLIADRNKISKSAA